MDTPPETISNSNQDNKISQEKKLQRSRNRKRNTQRALNSTMGPQNEGKNSRIQPRRNNSKPEALDEALLKPEPVYKPDTNTIAGGATYGTRDSTASSGPSKPPGGPSRRGVKFNAGLTDLGTKSSSLSDKPATHRRRKVTTSAPPRPEADDLTTRLTHSLSTRPYPDCPICFSSIQPTHRTWSCSPSIPVVKQHDAQIEDQQYCWTSFHVKCIGEWAAKSVKEVANAWRARGEEGRKGDWRCPGCQAKREIVPSGYWCFCNSTSEPKPPRLATPHSCANPCSRIRESGCGHPCPLACHPGPCPPCQVTTRMECYCPRKKVLAFRCGVDKGMKRDLSCGGICGRKLNCGNHTCEETCHEGPCAICPIKEDVRCWCGFSTQEVACGEGEEVNCVDGTGNVWSGRFKCDLSCQIPFDCENHICESPCHPPHKPRTCPLSPSLITTCPCGTHPIARATSTNYPLTTPTTLPARSSCASPIPTCNSPCSKPLPNCDHACAVSCHTGPCPPCKAPIVRPCRCGGTTRAVPCSTLQDLKEILCEKPCLALRACGKHQCRRQCCPLASLASAASKKGKKRATDVAEVGTERGGLHECDLVCGKMLGCGLHQCEERDHKGACPPCLRSSFEEMVCHCGRTVFEPPIPCGTQMECRYQCPRPPPPCGHPQSQHMCHEDPIPCPPCPFLATKQCACGKKMMSNVKCSLETEKVSCGTLCGKLMDCGFHHCERPCHGDRCGPCTVPCGKSRKLCLPAHHPCTRPCHAPSTCPEDMPCDALVVLSCPCGRLQQSIKCRRRTNAPSAHQQTQPKCNNECVVAKRNAKLADALGITAESREKSAAVKYHDELISFARANTRFLSVVEKAFDEFITSAKKTQVLPPMPPDRKKFVHDLSAVYRMDAEMVDQEPHRSVRLVRRVDSFIPSPLLSKALPALTPAPNLGKLADLRTAPLRRPSPGPSLSKPSVMGWATSRPTSRPASAAEMSVSVAPHSQEPTRLTASVNIPRASSPVHPRPIRNVEVPTSPIPDNWEDD